MGWTIAIAFFMGFVSLAVFIFFLLRGEFEDIEDVKYQLFHEEKKQNVISGTDMITKKEGMKRRI